MRTLLATLSTALFIALAAPMAASANQMPQNPPNPNPVGPNEPKYYEQFDCKNINTLTEWNACTSEPEV